MSKDELLQRAVQAHEAYVAGVERLREERRRAFIAASHGAVKNTEIARLTGLSNSQVGNVIAGKR